MSCEIPLPVILVVDDNPDDRALLKRAYAKHHVDVAVTEVFGTSQFDVSLQAGAFALVITDYHLQWTTGLDILQRVKARYPHCPVVMYTGTGTEEVAVRGLKAGLHDYVVKSERGVEEVARITGHILQEQKARARPSQVLLVDDDRSTLYALVSCL